MEFLKEIVPKLSHLAVFGTSTRPGTAQLFREAELAARAFGVKIQYLDVLNLKDVETAFRAAGKGRTDAILVLGGGALVSYRTPIVELALKSQMPAIFPHTYTG